MTRQETCKSILNWIDTSNEAVLLSGVPGIGKTHLMRRIREEVKGRRMIFEMTLREYDTQGALMWKLAEFLASENQTGALGLLKRQPPSDVQDVKSVLVAELLALEVLLLIDDLHAQPDDGEVHQLLKFLVERRAKGKGYSLLLASRKRPDWASELDLIIEELAGLDQEEVGEWLREERVSLSSDQLSRLHKITKGVPRLVKVFISLYVSHGVEKALDEMESVEPTAEPAGYYDLTTKDLSEGARELCRLLSVLSEREEWKLVDGYVKRAGVPSPDLDELERRSLLESGGEWIALWHDCFARYMYENLDDDKRKRFHGALAEEYSQELTPRRTFLALHHYIKAGKYDQGAQVAVKGKDGIICSEYREKTFAWLCEIPVEEKDIKLLEFRGDLAFHLGNYDIAEQDYRQLYQKTKDPIWLVRQGKASGLKGDYTGAARTLKQAVEESQDFPTTHIQALAELGRVRTLQGEIEKALELLRKAAEELGISLQDAESSDWKNAEEKIQVKGEMSEKETAAWILRNAGVAYINAGRAPAAVACWAAAGYLWKELGDRFNEAAMLLNIGAAYADHEVNLSRAEEKLKEARRILEDYGSPYELIRLYNCQGGLYLRLGKFDQGFAAVNKSLEIAKGGFVQQRSEALDVLGTLYATLGRWEEAVDKYKEAIKLQAGLAGGQEVYPNPSYSNLGVTYLAWGRELIAQDGDAADDKLDEAESNLSKYLELAGDQEGDYDVLAQTRAGLAEVALLWKDTSSAQKEIDKVKKECISRSFVRARMLRVKGELRAEKGEQDEARCLLKEAWNTLRKSGDNWAAEFQEDVLILKDLVKLDSKSRRSRLLCKRSKVYRLPDASPKEEGGTGGEM